MQSKFPWAILFLTEIPLHTYGANICQNSYISILSDIEIYFYRDKN